MLRHELVSCEQHESSTICALHKVLKEGMTLCSLELCVSYVPSLSLKPVSVGVNEILFILSKEKCTMKGQRKE